MDNLFITNININKVRHLENINIALSDTELKHLIITGKNGSGKTSVLESVKNLFHQLSQEQRAEELAKVDQTSLNGATFSSGAVSVSYSTSAENALNPIYVYLPARRDNFRKPKAVEPVPEKNMYHRYDFDYITSDGVEFIQYIVNLDYNLYGAQKNGERETAARLERWFANFQEVLREIYDCEELQLLTDTKNHSFNIEMPGRNTFGLHEMSDGYRALLQIVVELLMRFEEESAETFVAHECSAIVLIDEIDAHLHVELQRRVLKFLTKLFPNTQFIVATHSPFVITSLENAVVFDLEKKEMLEKPWLYSSETVVESFLDSSAYSDALATHFQKYKELCLKERTPEENEVFLRAKAELELMAPASKELYLAFRNLERERKAAKNG